MTGVAPPAVRMQLLVAFSGHDDLVFGSLNKQGLWPLGAVIHWRAKAFNVIHNVQEFVEFRKFPSSGFDSWNVGFAHLHLFKN
jgi:hypothetical protein